ncbi:MAG: L-serine ammonia-lyase, iron-sulfur-dependent subunit beta [Chitinophagaceae bacterium]|nr:L-serine ammonia-lyase, iron-sulfur-dependent subunit beta [Chitinophagaceae bacterium]
MSEKSSIFDMIGPIMIGPSSSHTAGVVKIGIAAMNVLGSIPQKAEITFYNSFAHTYEGHGSDKAIIAGLMGFHTDDARIKNSYQLAEEKGLKYTFKAIGNALTFHPNTIRLNLTREEENVEVLGESRGGGVIRITEIDGFNADFSANLITLIIKAEDKRGSIAYISDILAHDDCNIATMTVSRRGKNDLACIIIEIDTPMRPTSLEYIKSLHWVKKVIVLFPTI